MTNEILTEVKLLMDRSVKTKLTDVELSTLIVLVSSVLKSHTNMGMNKQINKD